MTRPGLLNPEKRGDDVDQSIRPLALGEFIGQQQAQENLKVFIAAAKARGEALDHVLFVGPPGLGKTTLAQIVARELGVNFRSTSGPVIAKAGDLAAQLTNLEERDVLFIDEIHRLNPAVEEILYPAMEDYQLDLIIGEGPAARSVKIDLPKFTLVGATTRAGLLTTPLRDRFGIPVRLNFYTVEELELIVTRGARVLGIGMTPDGANEIARRARGTPRIAGRLLRRVRDVAIVEGADKVTRGIADKALTMLDVDSIGLDLMDRRYLTTIAEKFSGARWASRPWPLRSPSRVTPSRTSSSPICSSKVSCSARRAGAFSRMPHSGIWEWPCRAAKPHSLACSRGRRSEHPHPPHLLRGHGFLRLRLSRALSAFLRAWPHGGLARTGCRSSRPVRNGGRAVLFRRAPHEYRLQIACADG